jgi:hypothetical protein
MHPIMHYDLAKARIADLHHQAERDRTARAARLARTDGSRLLVPAHQAMALARRALAVLGRRSLRPAYCTGCICESGALLAPA